MPVLVLSYAKMATFKIHYCLCMLKTADETFCVCVCVCVYHWAITALIIQTVHQPETTENTIFILLTSKQRAIQFPRTPMLRQLRKYICQGGTTASDLCFITFGDKALSAHVEDSVKRLLRSSKNITVAWVFHTHISIYLLAQIRS